jgi:hypothetical protein
VPDIDMANIQDKMNNARNINFRGSSQAQKPQGEEPDEDDQSE